MGLMPCGKQNGSCHSIDITDVFQDCRPVGIPHLFWASASVYSHFLMGSAYNNNNNNITALEIIQKKIKYCNFWARKAGPKKPLVVLVVVISSLKSLRLS